MARALALACGDQGLPGEIDVLTSEALLCPIPGAGLQVLALVTLADAGAGAPRVDGADIDRLAALVPADCWAKRGAILSTDESLTLLRKR